jgi:hypothetical protein
VASVGIPVQHAAGAIEDSIGVWQSRKRQSIDRTDEADHVAIVEFEARRRRSDTKIRVERAERAFHGNLQLSAVRMRGVSMRGWFGNIVDFVDSRQRKAEILQKLGAVAHVFVAVTGIQAALRDRAVLVYFFSTGLFEPFPRIAAYTEIVPSGTRRRRDEFAMDAVGTINLGTAFGRHLHCHLSPLHSI